MLIEDRQLRATIAVFHGVVSLRAGCLVALAAAGLNVHLHHNYSVHLHAPRTQYEYDLQVPLRKMVDCRTRDLHQSLLVKLNRALVRQGKSGSTGLEGARSLRAFSHHPALEGTGRAT